MTKLILGVLLIVAGIAAALYVGVWLCLIGGIVQFIEAVKATPVPALDVAMGIARVLCAGLAGVLTAVVAIFPGFALLSSD